VVSIGDLPLADEEQNALALVVGRLATEIVAAAAALGIDERVDAICLYHLDDQEDGLVVPPLLVSTRADRDGAVAASGDWVDAWDPNVFRDEGEHDPPDALAGDEDFQGAWRRLHAGLESRVMGPERWVLARVARELTHSPMPLATEQDFIVFAMDAARDPELLLEQIEFAASPDGLMSLGRRGLLGPIDE